MGWTLLVVLVVAGALAALTSVEGRLFVCLTVSVIVVLLMAPSFFGFYAAFAAPMFALLVPAAISGVALLRPLPASSRPRRVEAVTVASIAVVAVGVGAVESLDYAAGKPFPGRELRPVVASTRCVTSDSPWGLIALDALSRDFRNGCRVEIDVSGVTHDTLRLRSADGRALGRSRNTAWKAYLFTYLRSGEATIIMRAASGNGLTAADRKVIGSWPVLGQAGPYRIRQPGPARHG
ncbi:hypothetical protein [Phycicoccus ginsengisoli]